MNEVVDVLQHLVRNACVNDGSDDEPVDVDSLELSTAMWEALARDLCCRGLDRSASGGR